MSGKKEKRSLKGSKNDASEESKDSSGKKATSLRAPTIKGKRAKG